MKVPRLISRKSQQPPQQQQQQEDAPFPPIHKPLPQPQTECRLVCILSGRMSDPLVCSTSVVRVAEAAGKYHALSYCWGSQDRTRPVTCDGQTLNVTSNLESALKRLRSPNVPRTLWVDQLCLNQENVQEREQQVRQMADIYRHSCKVLIWLGDDGEDSRKADKIIDCLLRLDLSARLGEISSNDVIPQQTTVSMGLEQFKSNGLPNPKDVGWQELRNLLSRPWFSRIWAIQEAAVATNADFLWGKEYSLGREGMMSVIRLVREHLPKTLLGSDVLFKGLPADTVYRIAAITRSLEDRTHQDLFNMALTYKAHGSSKPHDKLFALLNISSSQQVADYGQSAESAFHKMAYQTVNQVYEEITRFPDKLSQQQWHPYPNISQGPHLRMIALICSAGIANQQLLLPSWVPDWTVDLFPAPIWTRKTCYKNRSSASTSDWPGAPPTKLSLEASTIINAKLAKMHWLAESTNSINSPSVPDTLMIKGLICDTISRRVFAKVDLGKPLELEEQQKALMEWLLEADEMADLGPETSYIGGADTELFRRTLLFDEDLSLPPADLEKVDLGKSLKFSKNSRFVNTMKRKLQPWDYLQAIQNIPGRTFFVTQGGRMGLAPHATHMYDKICVLEGFEVPLVLRPEGNEFRLVGECYAGNDDVMPGGSEYNEMLPEWITIK